MHRRREFPAEARAMASVDVPSAADSAATHRMGARLAELSYEHLLELATRQACANNENFREADAFVVQHQPLPEWARSSVLLSPDLLPDLLGALSTKQHEVKAVCKAWRRGWALTLPERPSELRLSSLPTVEVSGGDVMDTVALDEQRLMLVQLAACNTICILDQKFQIFEQPFNVRGVSGNLLDVRRLAVGNQSVYVSHRHGVERFALDGFITDGAQTSLAHSRITLPGL